jgi:dienelactone hydrolase
MRVVIRRPERTDGALPLIVFAHGYDTEPETYDRLLDTWAAAGYMVAAPELPGSAHDLPGTPLRDIGDQARDISFVTTWLLSGAGGPVDPTRVIAAGHSDGASAVAALAQNTAYFDSRFAAYVVLSGAIPREVTDGTWGTGHDHAYLLVTVGDNDEYGNLPDSEAVFDAVNLPGAFVRVVDGDHSKMYTDDSPQADSVRALTVQFLDLALNRNAHTTSAWETLAENAGFIVRRR